jgi:DNA-binding XRE family transcriptional regulator
MRADTRAHAVQYYHDFGQRLRALRHARGYTEKDAAATAGVTIRTWRRWEAGCVSTGNPCWIPAFSEKYDVSCAWLVSGKGPMGLSGYRCGNRPMLRLVKS